MINMKNVLILGFIFTSCLIICQNKKIIIPIGRDCETAIRLKELKLREVAYPFDWILTDDFDGLCKCIQEKFKYFFDPESTISCI
jgi:hypothetical protein